MLDWKLQNVFQSSSRKDSDSNYWHGTFTEHMLTCIKLVFGRVGGSNLQLVRWPERMINRSRKPTSDYGTSKCLNFCTAHSSKLQFLFQAFVMLTWGCLSDLRLDVSITRSFQLEWSTTRANDCYIWQKSTILIFNGAWWGTDDTVSTASILCQFLAVLLLDTTHIWS